MSLTIQSILAFKNLPGLGNKSIMILNEISSRYKQELHTISDLFELYKIAFDDSLLFKNSNFCLLDFEKAYESAEKTLIDSDNLGIRVIMNHEYNFPKNLRKLSVGNRDESPLFLFYKGNIDKINSKPGVAIIGSRDIISEVKPVGLYVSKKFADQGFNIISGLAIGSDTIAHTGALKSDSGLTTAILPSALNSIYPRSNTVLANSILECGGVLLSEYPVGSKLQAHQFIERDRLQAGLADIVVVLQTKKAGGTMHAVNVCLENKKGLYVIKYKLNSKEAEERVQGNLFLLQNNLAKELTSNNIKEVIERVLFP